MRQFLVDLQTSPQVGVDGRAKLQGFVDKLSAGTDVGVGGVAMFDMAHGQKRWGEDGRSDRPFVDQEFTRFAQLLEGFKLAPIERDDPLTDAVLAGVTLLVVVMPIRADFSPKEIDSVKNFVGMGGRFLALSYYGGAKHYQTNLQNLLAPFGIVPDDAYVLHEKLPGCQAIAIPCGDFAGNGESEPVHLPWCSTVTLRPEVTEDVQTVLSTDEAATRYSLAYYDEAVGRVRGSVEPLVGVHVVGAVTSYGRRGGRLAVVGSWAAFTNASLQKVGNQKFVGRLLDWLLEKHNAAQS